MSEPIICAQCQAHNPAGSKFCNNCGLPLGKASERRCPTCQKNNPITNYYCDHCGTRLIFEERAITQEKKEPTETADSSPKPFSLPTRETESLADLDPDDVLDWLNETKSTSDDQPDWIDELNIDRTGILSIPETGLLKTIDFEGTDSLEHDDFADLLELGSASESLPDWLADIPVVEATPPPKSPPVAADEAEAETTSPPEPPEEPKSEPETDSVSDADTPLPAQPAEELLRSRWDGNVQISTEDDWLTALGTAELQKPAAPSVDEQPSQEPSPEKPAETALDDSWDPTPVQTESDLPNWLHELQQPSPEDKVWDALSSPNDSDLIGNDELPAWVREMRPDETGSLNSSLPSATDPLSESNLPRATGELGSFEDFAELGDLEDNDLPDWLEGIPTPPPIFVEPPAPAPEKPETKIEEVADDDPPEYETIEDLTAALSAAPPPSDPSDNLIQETLPTWIRALNPAESQTSTQETLQRLGPLAGVRGVLDIEPIIAAPREANIQLTEFSVTAEQQQQAKLLQQIVRVSSVPTAVTTPEPPALLPLQIRLVLAILLLAGILIGVLGPNFMLTEPLVVPAHVAATHEIVQAAAGQTVLVAVDYTPAMAGELNLFTQTLGEQLTAQNSTVLTMSQSAAGTAVASNQLPDSQRLGLLPGSAVGLRQLRRCLNIPCNQLAGRQLSETQSQALTEVDLIIVLTSEQENVVGWAEQVAVGTTKPIVAATTQALQPLTERYLASGQLAGTLSSLPDLASYQQLSDTTDTETIAPILQAQTIAQLIILVTLIVGGIAYGLGLGGKK
ncbi:MAG: zinc ribbon domain-containing protein [Chloroflexota bacterium]